MRRPIRGLRASALVATAMTLGVVVTACQEKLPVSPSTFAAVLSMTGLPDTIAIGDSKVATAAIKDADNNLVTGLTYTWTVNDTTVLGLGASDSAKFRQRTFVAKQPGIANVTLNMLDPRFVISPVAKSVKSVISGIAFLTAKDTTITAIGDTIVVRATGYVKNGATTTSRPLLGLTWSVITAGASGITQSGDSAKLVAQTLGVDSLIIRHPYCLAGARCADTAVVRVTQSLKLALTSKALSAWSFGDTVFTSATVKDRRGLGQSGTYLKFTPRTAADSLVITTTALSGLNQPANGTMAVSKFIALKNGTAKVLVQAFNGENALFDTDSLTVTVRQVAARTTVFPLVASISHGDSIPLKAQARDARGTLIADATLTLTPVGGTLSGIWEVGTAATTAATSSVWAAVSGVALATNNTGAPAVVIAVDSAKISHLPIITAVAGSDSAKHTVNVTAKTFAGTVVSGAWVRFVGSSGVLTPDSALTGSLGTTSTLWTPSGVAGTYRFTAIQRSGTTAPATVADSAGLILARRTVRITSATAVAGTSTLASNDTLLAAGGTTTYTLTAKDTYGNAVASIVPADFVVTKKFGSFGTWTCSTNICSATYTAATTIKRDTIAATIGGTATLGSPLYVTTKAAAPSATTTTASYPGGNIAQGNTTTITVTVKDVYSNPVLTAAITDFVATTTTGTFGTWTCANTGVCTALWLAPNATSVPSLTIKIGGTNVSGSPFTINVP